jgi:CDGSH-type Zn-finger protein
MANIKVRQNGPYLIEGDDLTVVDWNGNEYEIPSRPFALCRCGGSTRKPFCDGTHSTGCREVAGWLAGPIVP